MLSIEEQIHRSQERTAKLERDNRIKQKNIKDAQKRKEQRRNYIIGELVSKYFPELLKLNPGTKAENHITFEPFESFLTVLAADKELITKLKEKAASQKLSNDISTTIPPSNV